MEPALIITHLPRFDRGLGIGDRDELMQVQTFVSEAPVETLNQRVLHGFAGAKKSGLTPCS